MFNTSDIVTLGVIAVAGFLIPGILTLWNLYNSISKRPVFEKLVSTVTVLLGGFFYICLYFISFDEGGDWYEAVNTAQVHNAIASDYLGIMWILLIGFIGYFVLLFFKAKKLPPLVSVIAIVMVILLNAFQISLAVQLAKNIRGLTCLLYVYHFNVLILSARVIRLHMIQQSQIFSDRLTDASGHDGFKKFYGFINNLTKYNFFVFAMLIIVIAIIEIIFVIAGQGLDAPIKAFTQTADWTFSKQIPPPPVEYTGHYLCTVAAGGHERVVRPLRLGSRNGATIVVNRQLCIANAFEEVIKEKLPAFHKRVRYAYDKYGYPVSNLITTPLKADVIYFIMKPLEWCFLLFLYLVDVRPEQRIKNQYILKER